MTKEQIKENLKQRLLNNHKDILEDICMTVHNCADCFDETVKRVRCNPHVETVYLSENGFCIEIYDPKTNEDLISLAEKHGYKVTLIFEKNNFAMIEYKKDGGIKS